jgi:hypothetical protein
MCYLTTIHYTFSYVALADLPVTRPEKNAESQSYLELHHIQKMVFSVWCGSTHKFDLSFSFMELCHEF